MKHNGELIKKHLTLFSHDAQQYTETNDSILPRTTVPICSKTKNHSDTFPSTTQCVRVFGGILHFTDLSAYAST